MKKPVQCVFWEKPELVDEPLEERFEVVETLADDGSHFWRYLLKCRECGQLYFFEFYEEVNWSGEGDDNDFQYSTWIPVSGEVAASLKEKSPLELLDPALLPRMQGELTPHKQTPVHLVGK